MKVLKILRIISFVLFIILWGLSITGIYSIDLDDFVLFGTLISLLAFYIISYLYEKKRVKLLGHDDKRIYKYSIINLLLLIIFILSYIINKTSGINNDSIILLLVHFYLLCYMTMVFPIFVSKYIIYYSKDKWYFRILGIVLFIIIFFIINNTI